MSLRITPLTGNVGASVEGINLNEPISPEVFSELSAAFLKYCTLVFRDQFIGPAAQVAFARHWGEPVVTAGLSKLQMAEHPEVIQITKIPKATSSTEAWHYDSPFTAVPPKLSILSAQVVPNGGDTMWTNQYVAYDRLSEGMKRMLAGVRVRFRGVRLARMQGIPDKDIACAVHPLVRTHPETGGKVLYIAQSDNIESFDGMTPEETRPLLDYLYAHCTQPDNIYRHMWRAGDVVMWDNRCTMHYAVHDYGEQERVLNRVTLKGEVPV
ncbi:TauD/TfdA family dioxygenase [Hydrogenophaga sp. 2FB]|uniref:TauD/TfdA dioxygenase family protein n=1 Tax=Hydrogenophaga sp. 2FB TaxID=2502187 RepID=UPI0010F545C7|nr:TauD/TfdA family dioxygenase [Hydrogenophaga sp. 2FB]